MTAFTPAANPPLPFTPRAVIDRFRFLANNAPYYVQIQATNALARILGLNDTKVPLYQRLADPLTEAPQTDPSTPAVRPPLVFITSEDELTEEDDEYL